MTRVSVVTPTFNRAHQLERNLRSVASQQEVLLEHVIVDSLSSDGTDKIVANYRANADYPVVYIREKDRGIYDGMNKGIRAASGVWVHILNSDDEYASDGALAATIAAVKDKADIDVVAGAVEIVSAAGTGSVWYPDYLHETGQHHFPHPGMVVKRSIYETYGYYDQRFRIAADAFFAARVLPLVRSHTSQTVLVRMHEGGVSTKRSYRLFVEQMIVSACFRNSPLSVRLREVLRYGRGAVRFGLSRARRVLNS